MLARRLLVFIPESMRRLLREAMENRHVLGVPAARRPGPGMGNEAGDSREAVEVPPDRLSRLAGDSSCGIAGGRTLRLVGSPKRAVLSPGTSRHNLRPANRVSRRLRGTHTAIAARAGHRGHPRVSSELPWQGERARHAV